MLFPNINTPRCIPRLTLPSLVLNIVGICSIGTCPRAHLSLWGASVITTTIFVYAIVCVCVCVCHHTVIILVLVPMPSVMFYISLHARN